MSEELNPAAEAFYDGAEKRIRNFMLGTALAATAGLGIGFGWKFGVGVLVGCAIAYLNFYWLKRAVTGLADRATRTQTPQSSGGMVARFLVRYALIAVAGYVIFRVSLTSLYGLLCGLFLPVAGILCEAVYEGYVALRKGY